MGKITKKEYREYLNGFPIPVDDRKSEGGRIPDGANYGDWLYRNDPIAFQVGYSEYNREKEWNRTH